MRLLKRLRCLIFGHELRLLRYCSDHVEAHPPPRPPSDWHAYRCDCGHTRLLYRDLCLKGNTTLTGYTVRGTYPWSAMPIWEQPE